MNSEKFFYRAISVFIVLVAIPIVALLWLILLKEYGVL